MKTSAGRRSEEGDRGYIEGARVGTTGLQLDPELDSLADVVLILISGQHISQTSGALGRCRADETDHRDQHSDNHQYDVLHCCPPSAVTRNAPTTTLCTTAFAAPSSHAPSLLSGEKACTNSSSFCQETRSSLGHVSVMQCSSARNICAIQACLAALVIFCQLLSGVNGSQRQEYQQPPMLSSPLSLWQVPEAHTGVKDGLTARSQVPSILFLRDTHSQAVPEGTSGSESAARSEQREGP